MWAWCPLLSQSTILCAWMIERGSAVVVTRPAVCELMTGNDADASCLTDETNDCPSSAPQPVSDIGPDPGWNEEEGWRWEVVHSGMNITNFSLFFLWGESKLWRSRKLCLSCFLRISSISRALLSQVNLGCQSCNFFLCRKALMWKIEDGCNLQGCYPSTPSHNTSTHTHTHTHTHKHTHTHNYKPPEINHLRPSSSVTWLERCLNVKHHVKHDNQPTGWPKGRNCAMGPEWPTPLIPTAISRSNVPTWIGVCSWSHINGEAVSLPSASLNN